MFLGRFRVLTKIFTIVILMTVIAAGITWLGTDALKTLNAGAEEMSHAAKRALIGARANQNVLVLSRSEPG